MKLLSVVFAVCCISAAYADDSNSEGLKEICCKTATPYLEAKKKPDTFFACIFHELVLQYHDKHCKPKLSKGILCCFGNDNNNVNNGGNDGVNNGDSNVPTDDGNKANNDVGNEDANSNNNIGKYSKEKSDDGSTADYEGEAGQDVGIDPEDDKQTNNEKPIEEGNTKSRQHAVKAKHHASKSKLQKKNKDNKKQKGASSKKKTHSKNKNHNNKGRTIKLSHKEKA